MVEIDLLGRRCQQDDWDAWNSLFPVAWPVLVKFAHRLYHSFELEDAEDVAQATLEAAIRGISSFTGRAPFRVWLFGIASQQARTHYRKGSAAKRGLKLLVPIEHAVDHRDETALSPLTALEVNERCAILHQALEELPDEDRELVHLHYFGELTFREIGEAKKMNPKTVCTRLRRCKEKLSLVLGSADLTHSNV